VRIVSLLPSATEIICQLGLTDQLVGVTHECDYPDAVRRLPKVTRSFIPSDAASREIDRLVRERLRPERALYSLDLPTLTQLRPDLIVTQTLCDVCAVAESEVREAVCSLPRQPNVVNLEPTRLEDVFKCLRQVATAARCENRAGEEILALKARVSAISERSEHIADRPRVVLLEWIDPPFSSGHWNPELVQLAGGHEVVGVAGERSRILEWEEIIPAAPQVMVIACCGFDVPRTLQDLPILRSYRGWNELPCVRTGRVYVVDGAAYFNRPGPRLVDSLEILAHALHPKIQPRPTGFTTVLQLRSEELAYSSDAGSR
jgi:iron complex transport system substrate-binding protein